MSEPEYTQVKVGERTLRLSNLTKELFPSGTTKAEVLDYYARIAPVMLPHLADRAVTRIRWPNGTDRPSFYEKNAPGGTPEWVRTVEIPTSGRRSGRGDGTLRFPIAEDLPTLTWLANLAAIELHVHQWRVADRLADRLVVDLDPGPPAGLMECSRVALEVKALADDLGVVAAPVLSGSNGLHVYLYPEEPMRSERASETVKAMADRLVSDHPRLVTATMTKSQRRGKVFLDWSQNAAAKTTISPYSLRGRSRPFVAAPVTWSEVEDGAEDEIGLEQLTFPEILRRVSRDGDLLPGRGAVKGS